VTAVLAGLAGGGWALLVGWIFPSIVFVTLFGVFVLPSLTYLPLVHNISALGFERAALVSAASGIALAVILNAIQVPLYRLLEGYVWPQSLQQLRRNRHLAIKRRLRADAEGVEGLKRDLLLEKYQQYPVEDDQVAPTRLGNAIRAFETYAFNRFNLDSQLLWSELIAVAPSVTNVAIERARAAVDFFVSLIYLSGLFAIASVAMSVFGHADRFKLLVIGLVAAGLTPVWYRLAVVSTSHWASAVQALVNLGRKPLAEALALEVPRDLKAEREMWRYVNWFVGYEFHPEVVPLVNTYRASASNVEPEEHIRERQADIVEPDAVKDQGVQPFDIE
jgi:hypothetical protein